MNTCYCKSGIPAGLLPVLQALYQRNRSSVSITPSLCRHARSYTDSEKTELNLIQTYQGHSTHIVAILSSCLISFGGMKIPRKPRVELLKFRIDVRNGPAHPKNQLWYSCGVAHFSPQC